MSTNPSNQAGAALGVALLLLTVLTLLALGAGQMSRARDTSAALLWQRETALQSAEAALRAAERLLDSQPLAALDTCRSERCRVYPRGLLENLDRRADDWWTSHAWAYTTTADWIPTSDTDVHTAKFVIEEIGIVTDSLSVSPDGSSFGRIYFRITAFARPEAVSAPVVLQSTFSRRVD